MKNVYILGTIHGTHEINPNYGFYHILEEVKRYKPDLLCVEIRAQDMAEANSYLRTFYPPEMVLLKEEYENRIPVYGFDWRGKAMENLRIGESAAGLPDIFSLMQKDIHVKELILQRKARMKPFFETCTLKSCQLEYSSYYSKIQFLEEQLEEYLKLHDFQELVNFNAERERRIQHNIKRLIENYPAERIMIVTGISHKEKIEDFLAGYYFPKMPI